MESIRLLGFAFAQPNLRSYIWRFSGGKPLKNTRETIKELPSRTTESDATSKDLKKEGIQIRWLDNLLCLYAGYRDGERPYCGLLQIQ
jgi:hypothetical protein